MESMHATALVQLADKEKTYMAQQPSFRLRHCNWQRSCWRFTRVSVNNYKCTCKLQLTFKKCNLSLHHIWAELYA
jgi:hypothetical protein